MKITTTYLRQVIKEELGKVLQEEERKWKPADIISKMEDHLKSQYKTDELKTLKQQFKSIINKLNDPKYYSIDDIKFEDGEAYPENPKFLGGYYSGWKIEDYKEVLDAVDRAIKDIDYEYRLSGYDTIDE